MNIIKRLLSCVLAFAIFASTVPSSVLAADNDGDEYSITNGYVGFSFNQKTGGFAIETAEGNPQKSLDDDMPLLYAEDKERSNGTSFVTVKIDDKEYVFGQDYGFFSISSHLGDIKVSEQGRLMEIPWTIEGVTVTLKAALDNNIESDTTGNVGLAFEVVNNSGKHKDVSVRLLLDTALGSRIDAPYFVVDTQKQATMTEKMFSDSDTEHDDVPQQIRAVDSLTNPSRMAYILLKGWNEGVEPNKVILGHWANMANTRYEYEADEYCDFTNYSNDYRVPDSAAALYWEGNSLENGDAFVGEVLYGVGNFSKSTEYPIGINITTNSRIERADDAAGYKNGGAIDLTVEIDNTVDNATQLSNVVINLSADEGKLEISSDEAQTQVLLLEKEVKTLHYTLTALPQDDLCAGTIYVSVSGTKILADGTEEDIEAAAQRSIVLPSVYGVSEVQLNNVSPKTVYTEGDKVITLSGKMKALTAVLANDAKVDLKLIHDTTGDTVVIDKRKITFLDDTYETLTFSTDETLTVGEYSVVFDIKDDIIRENLGCDKIACNQKLQVSADKKYQVKSYAMIALVRTERNNTPDYDFFTFNTEKEYLDFYYGKSSAMGEYSGEKLKFDFSEKTAIVEHEILLTVRGNLIQSVDQTTNTKFWQADYEKGDIILNNMLSYEGDKPLKIYKSGDKYIVEGDGLIKVINSINVWRSEWDITAKKGYLYTLDKERLGGGTDYELSLGGAATMIQTVGGFAVHLKYGVLSSQWYNNSDGMVTYGIGFGGSISIPIKEKKKTDDTSKSAENTDLTTKSENLSDAVEDTFKSSLTDDQDDISGDMKSLFGEDDDDTAAKPTTAPTAKPSTSLLGKEAPRKTSVEDKILKEDALPKGRISASVDNVLFGEKGEVESGYVKVKDTGFVGIDSTFSVQLPQNVLGSFVANAPGLHATVMINTIKNQYEIDAGLKIKIIECEGVLAFKQVNVKNKDVILPDKVEFYIRDGLKLPLTPPVLYMTGLGGGINGLADTIGGEFSDLPPLTILLYTRLSAINVLVGDFNAKISLSGFSLTGDMHLTLKNLQKAVLINAGIEAQWIEPWQLSLYGNVSILDGLIKGGLTVKIADDYFYGYICASLCVPDQIPLLGGKVIRGVEAAVSHQFIAARVTVIGIKLGVKYYWGGSVAFGTNVDLDPPPQNTAYAMAYDTGSEYAVGYYGTNVHALPTSQQTIGLLGADEYKQTAVYVTGANGKNALLIEIPYSGVAPAAEELELFNPDGKRIALEEDDGEGGGNMLLQSRDDGDFIYVTVTDPSKIKDGNWTVKYNKDSKFEISAFNMNSVDDMLDLDADGTTIALGNEDENGQTTANIGWKINGDTTGKIGTIDVYLTEDKDILSKIQTDQNTGDTLGMNICHAENLNLETAAQNITASIPEAMPSGKYYAVTTLSDGEGISLAISAEPIDFVNKKLPKKVEGVQLAYGGNGEIFVSVTDDDDADYTHYIAEIVADDGTTLENNIGQYEKGENFVFGKEALLQPGKSYHVEVKTLREEYKKSDGEYKTHYYYGDEIVASQSIVMPEIKLPVLIKADVNFDTDGDEINTNVKNVIIDYTFEDDVFVEMDLNGGKVYAFGIDPDPNDRSTYFRKNWRFVLDDLEDGDYVVDFTAYTDKKDHIKGSNIDGVENAYFGFTVDTSAPVLSLSQTDISRTDEQTGENIDMRFANNTVFADENGRYVIEGITEKAAKLTLDGEIIDENTEGVDFAANGSFTIEKALGADELYREHTIEVTDKAGNKTRANVWAVRKDGFAFDGIDLYLDGKQITADENGTKVITLKNGQTAKLNVYAVFGDKRMAVGDELIDWSVLYEKNAVVLDDGKITALTPAETAVKAKLVTSSMTSDATLREDGLCDYVIINIEDNSKDDLLAAIAEAKQKLADNPNVSAKKIKALQAAIDDAEELAERTDAAKSDYTDGVEKLKKAIAAFERTGSSSGGGGGSARQYTAVAEPTEHGTVTLSHTKPYSGSSLTITALPDDGYVLADMLINGISVGNSEIYTIKSVNEDITVKAIFAEKTELPFVDVAIGDWYWDYVKSAYENKYMLGMTDTTFEPQTTLTRAMFVTILHRLDGENAGGENPFVDVDDNAYYKNAVAWASANGIVLGISDTEFAPDVYITREQMAAILYRYAQYKGMDVSVGENTNILSYDDFADISEYAVSALQYAVGSGLMVGKTQSTLNPQDTATRAEAATVFVRFADMAR